jgi:tetratricopeptide (TPR) repeat protein
MGLRIAGFGFPTTFFVQSANPPGLVTNEKFGWFYQRTGLSRPHPCVIQMPKPAGTLRVFVLGESAAMGVPDPAFGFARILEVLLRDQFPGHEIEVVNAAMRGINSHVVRSIARECVRLQPDLFVIYTGNNEVVGLHGPGYREGYLTPCWRWLRFSQQLKHTRLGQLFWMAARGHPDVPRNRSTVQDMTFFRRNRVAADDWRRQAVYRNFERNLGEIVHSALGSGAPVILATVGANLKDFAPLGSLHRTGLASRSLADWETAFQEGVGSERAGHFGQALEHFARAQAIDDTYAELAYRQARCLLAQAQTEEALSCFLKARDLDALQFRADAPINDAVRSVAARRQTERLSLVDVEKLLAQPATDPAPRIPGADLFLDHVHYGFDGDYVVACALFASATNGLCRQIPQLAPRGSPILSRSECARRLGLSLWDEVQLLVPMVELTRKPPFLDQADHEQTQARSEERLRREQQRLGKEPAATFLKTYDYALALTPDDWMIRYNYSILLGAMSNHTAAARELDRVVHRLPHVTAFRLAYGQVLAKIGRMDEARQQVQVALKLQPRSAAVRDAIQTLYP